MEWICMGKGIVFAMNLTIGLFWFKTRDSFVHNEITEKKNVSAVSLFGTLHVNWWNDNLFRVLVVW